MKSCRSDLIRLRSNEKRSIMNTLMQWLDNKTFDKIILVLPNFNEEDCKIIEILQHDNITIFDLYHPDIAQYIYNDRVNHKHEYNMFFGFLGKKNN